MVLTWNAEPSTEQGRASPTAFRPSAGSLATSTTSRFVYDGVPRTHNFLNGDDGQGGEARHTMAPANTCTHTRYAPGQAGGGASTSASMAAEAARSLNSVAVMRSARARSATARSLGVGDTRYSHLAEPHEGHVGPGAYAPERALPCVGPLALDNHLASSSPQRDPFRMHASFLSPQRPSSATWVRAGRPDAVYISPDFVPGPGKAPRWELSQGQRPDAEDWRFASRIKDAKREASPERDARGTPTPPADLLTDCAGRPLDVSLRASLRNASGPAFTSKEPRTLPLPVSRHNDVRAQRFLAQHQANTAHLGPGCYSPPNSTGGAKRRTYRIYVDPFAQPRPSGLGAGSEPRSGSSSPASSAFAGTFRAHKAGPFNSRTDSSLVARR